jgi:hypothetical protein
LITGPFHYEKATVISVEKGIITLSNNMKIDREYQNVTKSNYQAQPWDEQEFEYQKAYHSLSGLLDKYQNYFRKLDKDSLVLVYHKLNKLATKINLPH